MRRERQLSLNDALNYVALVLRNHPEVTLDRMREISAEVSGIDDADRLKETILHLAGAKRIEGEATIAQIKTASGR